MNQKRRKNKVPHSRILQIINAMKTNSISKKNDPHENKGPSKREHMCTHKKFEK
jgi:hypothetical protein